MGGKQAKGRAGRRAGPRGWTEMPYRHYSATVRALHLLEPQGVVRLQVGRRPIDVEDGAAGRSIVGRITDGNSGTGGRAVRGRAEDSSKHDEQEVWEGKRPEEEEGHVLDRRPLRRHEGGDGGGKQGREVGAEE